MPSCCVPLCESHSSRKKVTATDCRGWHNLPNNDNTRKEWLVSIRRGTSTRFPDFPKDFRACGLHFEDNCFERDFRHEFFGK